MQTWTCVGIVLLAGTVVLHDGQGQETEANKIARLIQQLGHVKFGQRELASKELDKIGAKALNALRAAAATSDHPEVRVRAAALVRAITARLENENPNLIVNGSFEASPEVGDAGFLPLDENSAEIRGWVVTRGQIDLMQGSGKWKAPLGQRSLDLHGSPGFGGVKQSFATKVGHKYKLTFRMSGNTGLGQQTFQMVVRAAAKKEVFEWNWNGMADDLNWEAKSWEFTAVDTITVLELHTAMAPAANAFAGPMLDNVKVVALD